MFDCMMKSNNRKKIIEFWLHTNADVYQWLFEKNICSLICIQFFLIIHSEYWCKMLYISLSVLGICSFIFFGFHIKESLSVKGSKCNGLKWSEIG